MEIAAGFGISRDAALALGLLVHLMILATTSVGGVSAIAGRSGADASRREARRMTGP